MVGLGIISLLVTAVGAGLQYRATRKAAATQDSFASLNFEMQTQQIAQQQEASRMQSLIQQQIASNEKAAMDRNAATLEQQAQVATTAGAENMRRTREDYARMLAAQRAQLAKGGVVDTTGSPLQMLTFTAQEEQRAADEALFQTEQQRRGLFREADNQRAEGVNAEMEIFGAQARGGAARLQAQNALSQAQMDLASVRANSVGMRRSATAGVLSNVGQLANQAQAMNWRTPRTASFTA